MNKIELLAPVGSKEALSMAINHGADAVYLGGINFGARAYANNFTNEDIIEAIDYAHCLGVKVYVTVNTLIKDSEFNEALTFIKFLYCHNVDAVIVQDLGLLNAIRYIYPNLVIHASTQMNVHSVSQAQTLLSLGVKRIVLARETPLEIVKAIAKLEGLEVEVFVHGALCYSYSGNCYYSSLVGKRSGNRGRCAQPCRMLYALDGVTNNEYLLSTKDLMTIDYLEELVKAGVKSLKIEGRMKRPEYVGVVVKAYKDALEKHIMSDTKKNLALMFNREFTKGFLNNETNRDFTNTKSPNHIGLEIGKVVKVDRNYAYIKLTEPLNNNDSLRILSSKEDAITINGINVNGKIVKTAQPNDIVKVYTHHVVDNHSIVLKTSDAKLIENINNVKKKQITIDGKLSLESNHLVLEVNDGNNIVKVLSDSEVEVANNETVLTRIIEQINKTNNTNYYFRNLEVNLPKIILPIKEINEIRRKTLNNLDEIRMKKIDVSFGDYQKYYHHQNNKTRLIVKVRNENQLKQAISLGIKDIIVENKEYLKYKTEDVNIYLISPRIDYKNHFEHQFDGANNLNLQGKISGPYLNIFNSYAVNFMHAQGFDIVSLSIELSKSEIINLLDTYKKTYQVIPNVMVMVYGYYDLMISKHCMINKALGLDKKGCKKCYEKQFYLKDRVGIKYPLIDDGACNLKVLNDKPLVLIDYIQELKDIGVNNFLIDFSIEEDITKILSAYINAFKGNEYYLKINSTLGHFQEGVI